MIPGGVRGIIFYSTIAQLVERMTVNHDVTGSNPVGGVTLFHYNSLGRVPYIGRHWS